MKTMTTPSLINLNPPEIKIKNKMKIKGMLVATLVVFSAGSTFAVEISLETAPPVVVKTQPVAGSTQVDPRTSEIVVKFSKVMQDGSWSWSTWGEENYPETTGQPKYLQDGRTCVLPVKLEPGKTYAIWVNSANFGNFKDAGGRSALPYFLVFKTAKERPRDKKGDPLAK